MVGDLFFKDSLYIYFGIISIREFFFFFFFF